MSCFAMMLLKRVVVFLISLLVTVQGCGIITHIEVAERAQEFFFQESEGIDYRELISKHEDAYQAGSPYPDAYYPDICFDGAYHAVAEDTHWTPFLKAAIDYIRENRPRPWDEATEKLVVFLLAIVQHQIADVSWHSLGIQQGFLRTMGAVNYHGSFDAAHSDGDFGADVVSVYELDMDYVGVIDKWYVPTDDLLDIYTELYGTPERMTEEVVENCTFLLFLGRLGENIGVIDLLYPSYAEDSPFLIDHLNGYYLGGMDDMATWSAAVMGHTVTMLNQGTDVCDLPNNPLFITCNHLETTGHHVTRRSTPLRNERNPGINEDVLRLAISGVDPSDVITEKTERGIYFSPSDKLKEKIRKRQKENQVLISQMTSLPVAVYDSGDAYGRLGTSMTVADMNGDGHDDLILGAPGTSIPRNAEMGAVHIIYGDESGLPTVNASIEDLQHKSLKGTAVSQTHRGSISYDVKFILLYATETIGGGSGWLAVLMLHEKSNAIGYPSLCFLPPISHECVQLNGRFGHAVAVVDINADGINDLAVSAPSVGADVLQYHGVVYVFYGDPETKEIQDEPGITYVCDDKYCNFGWSLASGDLNGDGYSDLVIGSPFAPGSSPGGEQRGTVTLMYADSQHEAGTYISTNRSPGPTIEGEQNYDWLGYSLSVGQTSDGVTLIAVGAPEHRVCARPDCGYDQGDQQAVGKVILFTGDLTPHSQIIGSTVFGQLGFAVTIGEYENQSVLAVSAATAHHPNAEILQVGVVYLYPVTTVGIADEPMSEFIGDREFGRFGGNINLADVDRDGSNDVVISAPLRSETILENRVAGNVYVFLSSGSFDHVITKSAADADHVVNIGENRARSGTAVSVISTESKVQLISSAPHSSTRARLAGRIALHEF